MNGKVVKSATDKINNGNILYIVSAYLRDMVLSIEQIKVDDKFNEITAIPVLLDLLEIKGADYVLKKR